MAKVQDNVPPIALCANNLTPEEIHAARLNVCLRATSAADAQDLLAMLGLLDA